MPLERPGGLLVSTDTVDIEESLQDETQAAGFVVVDRRGTVFALLRSLRLPVPLWRTTRMPREDELSNENVVLYVADERLAWEEIRDLGLTATTLEQFVRLRDHGVRAEFVKGMKSAGYDKLPTEDLVRARDHGVTPEYIADMKELGLKELTLEQIVRLRDHGITPGFVNHAKSRGFKPETADELIRLKNGGLYRDRP